MQTEQNTTENVNENAGHSFEEEMGTIHFNPHPELIFNIPAILDSDNRKWNVEMPDDKMEDLLAFAGITNYDSSKVYTEFSKYPDQEDKPRDTVTIDDLEPWLDQYHSTCSKAAMEENNGKKYMFAGSWQFIIVQTTTVHIYLFPEIVDFLPF